jgi:ribosome-binding protein aMBF1 (putative translation factor)
MAKLRETAEAAAQGAAEVRATDAPAPETASDDLDALRRRDPYDDPPLPLRAVGHGPAHPAGKAARELGRLVAAYREARGLTQVALGERLGWPQPNVARLEAGHRTPDLATLDRLARRLGLEVTVRATPGGLTVELREARTVPGARTPAGRARAAPPAPAH